MIFGIGCGLPFSNQKSKLVVYDSFNRANGVLGKADTGQTWQTISGNWVINNNQASVSSPYINQIAIINSGISDGIIQVDCISTQDVDTRLYLRTADVNNFYEVDYLAGAFRLIKRLNGSYTVLATNTMTKPSSPFTIKAVLLGNTITVFVNDTQIINVNDSAFSLVTSHGIGSEQTSGKMDNFKVVSL